MITDLIYRCPFCGCYDWLEENTCRSCRAVVDRIGRTALTINGDERKIAHWYDRVLAFGRAGAPGGMKSKTIRLSEEIALGTYRGLGGIRALHYGRRPVGTGRLCLEKDRLVFSGSRGALALGLSDLLSLTIESNTVIVVSRGHGPLFFDFLEESGKKWEDGLRRALDDFHAPRIVDEYFPRIRFTDTPMRAAGGAGRPGRMPGPANRPRDPHFFYDAVRFVLKRVVRAALPLAIEGVKNIPARGAAVLMANHSSFLDSILLETFLPRHVWFMAKNSQYNSHPLLFWFMALARSFPVRRYTVDAQAVRNAMGVVAGGHVLGIFPEGERNWDGRMLPFKRGTMRLVLALGKPVIPVGISGAYGLMPRWTHTVSRVPVTVRIGRPMAIKQIPAGAQTAADIAWITEKIRSRIQELVGPC